MVAYRWSIPSPHSFPRGDIVLRVLIADDDHCHTFLLEMFLRKWGYEVTRTDDGEKAIQQLRCKNYPCIVVLDRCMPGIEGTEVCREIKRFAPDSGTYVLMLTTNAQLRDRQQALAAGTDAYMTKPYEPEELRTKLSEASQLLQSHPSSSKHAERSVEVE